MKHWRDILLLTSALLISVKTSVSFDGERETDSAGIISHTSNQELQRLIGRNKDSYSVMYKKLRSRNRRTAKGIRGTLSEERKRRQNSRRPQNGETAQERTKTGDVRRYLRNNRRKREGVPQFTQEYDRVRNSLNPELRGMVIRSDETEFTFFNECMYISDATWWDSKTFVEHLTLARKLVMKLRLEINEEHKWLTDTTMKDSMRVAQAQYAAYVYLRPGRIFSDKYVDFKPFKEDDASRLIGILDGLVYVKRDFAILYLRLIADEKTMSGILVEFATVTPGTAVTAPPSTRKAPTASTPPTSISIDSYFIPIHAHHHPHNCSPLTH